MIAVASIHESLERYSRVQQRSSRKRWAFSLIHYSKAIQLLIKDDQQSCDRLGTAIVMCILFIDFEEFQSGYFACALHLRIGLALLQQWSKSETIPGKSGNRLNYTESLINQITPVLNRLMVQASTFADSRIHVGQYITYTVIPAVPLVPPLFRSLAEARVVLDEFMRWMFYLVNNPERSPMPTVREMLEQALKDWLRSFSYLLPCAEAKLEAQDLRAVLFIQLSYHVSCIIHGCLPQTTKPYSTSTSSDLKPSSRSPRKYSRWMPEWISSIFSALAST